MLSEKASNKQLEEVKLKKTDNHDFSQLKVQFYEVKEKVRNFESLVEILSDMNSMKPLFNEIERLNEVKVSNFDLFLMYNLG